MIDLTRYTWTRLDNIDAACFFHRLYPQELFWGRARPTPRLAALTTSSPRPRPTRRTRTGTPSFPILETVFFGAEPGIKTFQNVFLTYDMVADGGTPPTLRVSAANSPEASGLHRPRPRPPGHWPPARAPADQPAGPRASASRSRRSGSRSTPACTTSSCRRVRVRSRDERVGSRPTSRTSSVCSRGRARCPASSRPGSSTG